MAWIATIAEEQAQGPLAELYAGIRAKFGIVPNIMKALSLRHEMLEKMSGAFMTATFGGSRLSRVQEEMIATVVSSINRCHY